MSQPAPTPHLDHMRQAIALATENVTSGRGGPFGAVVARGTEVVATGVNLVTSTNDPTAHAEITAIRRAAAELDSFSLAGLTLYSSCEPCPMCLAASFWARLDAAFFGASSADAHRAGFDDAAIYREITAPLAERTLPMEQLLAQEAWAPFATWQQHPVRVAY